MAALFSASNPNQPGAHLLGALLNELNHQEPYVVVLVVDAKGERVLEARLDPLSDLVALLKLHEAQPPDPFNPTHGA